MMSTSEEEDQQHWTRRIPSDASAAQRQHRDRWLDKQSAVQLRQWIRKNACLCDMAGLCSACQLADHTGSHRIAYSGPPHPVRGLDYPCEDCGALAGFYEDDGWFRCVKCGYPGK